MCNVKPFVLGIIFVLFVFLPDAFCGTYGGGAGTTEDPFVISNSDHLQEIGNNNADWGAHFIMTADIDMSGYNWTSDNMIGVQNNTFTGVFDGDGHVISNFTFNTEGSNIKNIGLFGIVNGEDAALKNIGMENVSISNGDNSLGTGGLAGSCRNSVISNCYVTGRIGGGDFVGGLSGGTEDCTVTNCYTICSIVGLDNLGGLFGGCESAITNCYSTGDVGSRKDSFGMPQEGSRRGGLVGKNLGTITDCYATGNVSGDEHVGCLIGINTGTVTGCHATGNVDGVQFVGGLIGYNMIGYKLKEVSRCYATGDVTGQKYTGGLVGNNGLNLTESFASGDVLGTSDTGGLVGIQDGLILANCYALGNVAGKDGVGGLIGFFAKGTVYNCYETGKVSGDSDVGGLLGRISYGVFMNDCFWNSEVNSESTGVGSREDSYMVVGKTTVEMRNESTYTSGGWDFVGENSNGTDDIWQMTGCGFPVLAWQSIGVVVDVVGFPEKEAVEAISSLGVIAMTKYDFSETVAEGLVISQEPAAGCQTGLVKLVISAGVRPEKGTGTVDDPFKIWTAEEMNAIGTNYLNLDKHYILMADIDMGAYTGMSYNIIGKESTPFSGRFDGNGFVISNLTINTGGESIDHIGLFGYIEGEEAEVENLNLTNVSITGDNRSSFIGAVAGRFKSGIISSCHVDGRLSGYEFVGGLLGRSVGTVIDCSVSCNVICYEDYAGGLVGSNWGTLINCETSGVVDGDNKTGGLAGYAYFGTIDNCRSSSEVIGNYCGGIVGYNNQGTIINSSSSGPINGKNAGGLVCINSGGHITNCFASGDVSGRDEVGGLVGHFNNGNINDCYATGNVSGIYSEVGGLVGRFGDGVMERCYATGNAVSGSERVGGLVGANIIGTILSCYATCNINGQEYVGGIAGSNGGTIENCYAFVSVTGERFVGGLAGTNSKTISNCFASGIVLGWGLTGGFIGEDNAGIYVDCFWNEELNEILSGIGNLEESVEVTGSTSLEMKSIDLYTNSGWDFSGEDGNGTEDFWHMPSCGYPVLSWESVSTLPDVVALSEEEAVSILDGTSVTIVVQKVHSITVEAGYVVSQDPEPGCEASVVTLAVSDGHPYQAGAGTADDPYQIVTAGQMNQFGLHEEDWNKQFILMNDIDLGEFGWESYNSIGSNSKPFIGVFDGNHHSISGLTIETEQELIGVGLFNYIGISGELRDLELVNIYINTENCIAVGGLAGSSKGTIVNCSAEGKVVGRTHVGGLVGKQYQETVMNCYAMCSVTGESYVGGFTGQNNSGILIHCYANGSVVGNTRTGCLVGEDFGGQYSNCFWDNEANTGLTGVGNIADPDEVIGKTTTEMQMQTIFTDYGWDFDGEGVNGSDEIWRMSLCGSPMHSWQAVRLIPDVVLQSEVEAISLIEAAGLRVKVKNERNDVVPLGYVASQEPSSGCEGMLVTIVISNGSPYERGTGSAEDPFEILTAEQLVAVGEHHEDWDRHFILTAAIDMSDFEADSYKVIGNSSTNFSGVFDGGGNTVLNFTYSSDGDNHTGLFGYVGEEGSVRNLGMRAFSIDTGSGDYAGSVAGISFGLIENCFASGDISGGDNVGGLTGANGGIVANCYSACNVSGDESVGGLAGASGGEVSNCYSLGVVSGENLNGVLVGRDSNCSYEGNIWSVEANNNLSGIGSVEDPYGVIAKTFLEMQDEATFIDVDWDFIGESSNGNDDIWRMPSCGFPCLNWQVSEAVPDVTGISESEALEALSEAGLLRIVKIVHSDIFPMGQVISQEPAGGCYGLAVVLYISRGLLYGEGDGSMDDPFQIWTAEQLNTIGLWPSDWDKHFVLKADIDLSDYTDNMFNIIGDAARPFTGTFDGNGYAISNFTYVSSDRNYVGLFGYLNGGEVLNLGLEYVSIDSAHKNYVGGLAGYCQGNISNCYVSGSVSGHNYVGGLAGYYEEGGTIKSYAEGDVSGNDKVGGLFGEVETVTIMESYAESTVVGNDFVGGLAGRSYGNVNHCFASCEVRGEDRIGGLAGGSGGTIVNSYAHGIARGNMDVAGLAGANAGSITNCFAANTVVGVQFAGGLVGSNYGGSYTFCFWDDEVNASLTGLGNSMDPVGIMARNTSQMQTQSSFTLFGWDFIGEDDNGTDDFWRLCDNGTGYPALNWEYLSIGDFFCPDGTGLNDLEYLAERWLMDETDADLNGDGVVDILDFAIMTQYWILGG